MLLPKDFLFLYRISIAVGSPVFLMGYPPPWDSPRSVWMLKWVLSHGKLTCLIVASFTSSQNGCSVGMGPRRKKLTVEEERRIASRLLSR